jgi:glutamine amidotransferase|tara:strand:+ start:98 stop:736 length:639 start_codon:yes stop_codon:yes gene_type:complete
MLTALIDYDSGNLHSAQKAFESMASDLSNEEVIVTKDPDMLRKADRIVLPGDGAFPACKAALSAKIGLFEALLEAVEAQSKPFLGICVGMQMMARFGHEYETTTGLNWVDGNIRPIKPANPKLKIPHMGWNDLVITGHHPVLAGLKTGDHVYFVHSYQFEVEQAAQRLAHVDYAGEITAIVSSGTCIGTQFHPEKSQRNGLQLISNFLNWRP